MLNNMRRISDDVSSLLDFVRGFSAQLVVIGHLLAIYELDKDVLDNWKLQNFGVMVFFILSGFLIFYTAASKGVKYGIIKFLIDRAARIFTPLLPSLVLILLVDCLVLKSQSGLVHKWSYSGLDFLLSISLLQNHPVFLSLFDSTSLGSGRPLWTVSVEWVFYVCFAFIFYWNQITSKKIAFLIGIFFMLTPLYYIAGRGDGLTLYWLLGAMLGFLFIKNIRVSNSKFGAMLIVLFGFLAFIFRAYIMNLKDFYDIGLAACMAIVFYGMILMTSLEGSLMNKFFLKLKSMNAFLASFSYSLYLVHYTLIYLLMSILNDSLMGYSIIFNYVLVNGLSFVFYLAFERHFPKVKLYFQSYWNKVGS